MDMWMQAGVACGSKESAQAIVRKGANVFFVGRHFSTHGRMAADMELHTKLGEGSFASAYAVVGRGAAVDAPPIAVAKIFFCLDTGRIGKHFDKERNALHALTVAAPGHECLIRLLHSYIDANKDQAVIFLELGPQATLDVRSVVSAPVSSSPSRL
jgi:hypothetical protein